MLLVAVLLVCSTAAPFSDRCNESQPLLPDNIEYIQARVAIHQCQCTYLIAAQRTTEQVLRGAFSTTIILSSMLMRNAQWHCSVRKQLRY
jgi:hypothetical protein